MSINGRDTAPSTNGDNGRGLAGRLAKGNPGGPGNPHAQRVAALRAAVAKLVSLAKAGDLAAIRELLDRVLGKPLAGVAVQSDSQIGVAVIQDDNWYGTRAHELAAIRQEMLNEPEYLVYLGKRALKEDKKP